MNEKEMLRLQRQIDRGIVLAQERMVEKSRRMGYTIVVFRDGKVQDIKPEEV